MKCVVTKKQTHDLNSEGKFSSVTFQRALNIISLFHAQPYYHSWLTIFFLCYQTLYKGKKLFGSFKPSLQTSWTLSLLTRPNFFSTTRNFQVWCSKPNFWVHDG